MLGWGNCILHMRRTWICGWGAKEQSTIDWICPHKIDVEASIANRMVCEYRACREVQSVQFKGSVLSDSLQPHGLQHARLPCPSPTPRACSNSNPLSWWCHKTISSSVMPFSSCLQSFPTSESSPMSQFVASGSQSIGASASASVLPVNIQGWFPLRLTGLISLQSKRLSRAFSPTPQFKSIDSSALSFLYSPILTSIHD